MQLRKAYWKANRDRRPCVHCGQDHLTRQHNKTDVENAAELRSRRRNPEDPLHRAEAPAETKTKSWRFAPLALFRVLFPEQADA
jgi:hypothetical protein